MTILKRGYRFLRYNDHKWLSVQCWIYSAIYRLQVLYGNTTRLRVKWGDNRALSICQKGGILCEPGLQQDELGEQVSGAGTYCAEIIEKQRDFFYNVSGM